MCSLLLSLEIEMTFGQQLNTHKKFKWLAKALIRLRVCAGWSEALLVAYNTLLEISCRGSYVSFTLCLLGNFSCLFVHRASQANIFRIKLWLFSYPSVLTCVFDAQKNRLIETVLLSTHNICFCWEIRKIIFSYALLLGACCHLLIIFKIIFFAKFFQEYH